MVISNVDYRKFAEMVRYGASPELEASEDVKCPVCNTPVVPGTDFSDWPGLPAGVVLEFNPSDKEIIGHLIAYRERTTHEFLDLFIHEDDGIRISCTLPQDLPGVKADGFPVFFYHATTRTGNESTEAELGNVNWRWEKTGSTASVIDDMGNIIGYKVILLYSTQAGPGGSFSWVIHQYFLNKDLDDEKVISKVFSRQKRGMTISEEAPAEAPESWTSSEEMKQLEHQLMETTESESDGNSDELQSFAREIEELLSVDGELEEMVDCQTNAGAVLNPESTAEDQEEFLNARLLNQGKQKLDLCSDYDSNYNVDVASASLETAGCASTSSSRDQPWHEFWDGPVDPVVEQIDIDAQGQNYSVTIPDHPDSSEPVGDGIFDIARGDPNDMVDFWRNDSQELEVRIPEEKQLNCPDTLTFNNQGMSNGTIEDSGVVRAVEDLANEIFLTTVAEADHEALDTSLEDPNVLKTP